MATINSLTHYDNPNPSLPWELKERKLVQQKPCTNFPEAITSTTRVLQPMCTGGQGGLHLTWENGETPTTASTLAQWHGGGTDMCANNEPRRDLFQNQGVVVTSLAPFTGKGSCADEAAIMSPET